jgi:predicted nucleic acid-binding protein
MFIVDTNIVSFYFRRDSRMKLYQSTLEGKVQVIAFVTLAEIYKWPIERDFSDDRRTALLKHLRSYVVLPFDDALARRWAMMSVNLKREGKGISDADGWIAATALRYNLPLVTHNRRHFEHIPDLTIISES